MKNLFNFLSILCIAVTTLACGKEPQSGAAEDFNISGIVIPKSLSVRVGDEVQFKVIGSKGPKTGDQARLSPDTEGSPFDIALESCKTDSFVLTIPEGFTTGTYTMYIVRGGVAKTVGRLTASVLSSLDVTPP